MMNELQILNEYVRHYLKDLPAFDSAILCVAFFLLKKII